MSDMYDDQFAGYSDEDFLQMIAGQQYGGLPGKTPAAQLNYYQDLMQTLGFDISQQQGLGYGAEPTPQFYEPTWQEPVSTTRIQYEGNPVYAELFDRIDQGADPVSAYRAVLEQHKDVIGDDDEAIKDLKSIATSYAGDKAKAVADRVSFEGKTAEDRAKFERENGASSATYGEAGFDASKYKNAPLGGPDVMASASEYDLLGAPSQDDVLANYAATKLNASARTNGRGVKDGTVGDINPQAQNAVRFRPVGQAGAPKKAGYQNTKSSGKRVLNENGTRTGWTGNEEADNRIRWKLAEAEGKSKSTAVRSDANANAMRRILSLSAILGGGG